MERLIYEMRIRCRAFLVALLFIGVCLLCLHEGAEGKPWSKPAQLNKSGGTVLGADGDVGKRGYAVMSWAQKTGYSTNGASKWFGYLRVKAPGKRVFGKQSPLGRVSAVPRVSIGENGHTLVTWSRPNGVQAYLTRGPRTKWGKLRQVPGKGLGHAIGGVGPDGTMALMSSVAAGTSDPKARVLASIKMPGSKKFFRWKKVSGKGVTVGFDSDLAVRSGGRATVVWSGACPLGSSGDNNAMWVDLRGKHATRPREIPDSKCVAFDIDLQQDRAGFQYLRIGGSEEFWLGVKLSVRAPGKGFSRAQFLSPIGQFTSGGKMAVSPQGQGFVFWSNLGDGENAVRTRSFDYVTFRRDKERSVPRSIEGPRIDLSGRRDHPMAMGFLPGGSLSTVWIETLEIGRLNRTRLSAKVLDPFAPKIDYKYEIGIAPDSGAYPPEMAVAPDGGQLVWWTVYKRGKNRKIQWIQASAPTKKR